ncbi:MAG: hypothetical protein BWY81_00565 [Firmicutes bacterium ADurb.Bin467]|jgi:hypothetical protein|nr:MAG: hypothetical protein BWY81_00565 [Firmicutes bacterium ADurb.Bin467]
MITQNGAYLTVDRVLEQASALDTAVPEGGILMKTILRLLARLRARTAARSIGYFDIRERREAAIRKERHAANATAEMAWRPWR